MNLRSRFAIFFALACICSRAQAQDIDPINFDNNLFSQLVINGINEARWRSGMDSVMLKEELSTAADELAQFYKQEGKVILLPGEAGVEAKKAGATKKVE